MNLPGAAMAYIGCALFGLIFLVMTAEANGSLQARVAHTVSWIHGWAPFSYLLILILVLSPAISMQIVARWPKYVEPEDPMAKYRRQARGLDAVPED